MTWQDRIDLLNYHGTANEVQVRLSHNARNTLVDFVDELKRRLQIDANPNNVAFTTDRTIIETINEMLTEIGVEK